MQRPTEAKRRILVGGRNDSARGFAIYTDCCFPLHLPQPIEMLVISEGKTYT
jgi:hypothetical protein